MKILHIIVGLKQGGAEETLFKIIKNDNLNKHVVVSLTDKGIFGEKIKNLNKKLYVLYLEKNINLFYKFYKLFKFIRFENPDVVQTWMHHADLFGGIAAKLAGIKRIYWNLRVAELAPEIKLSNKITIKLCVFLSYIIPTKVISCSKRGISVYQKLGYKDNFVLIPNGFDEEVYYKSHKHGLNLRKKFAIDENVFLVTFIARWDPQKNHIKFFEAFQSILKEHNHIKCICAGRDINYNNFILVNKLKQLNIINSVLLIDEQSNLNQVYNAADLNILPSKYGEAFPNVIAESMLTGTPCMSTDVGDSINIINSYGWIISGNLEESIFNNLQEILRIKENQDYWQNLSDKCIKHIKLNYSINKLINEYNKVWKGS